MAAGRDQHEARDLVSLKAPNWNLPSLSAKNLLWCCLLLTLAGVFVLPHGRANNFPTYLVFVLLAVTPSLRQSALAVMRGGLWWFCVLLTVFLAASSLWSTDVVPREVISRFVDAGLTLAFIVALGICTREPEYLRALCLLIVIAAVGNALFALSHHVDPFTGTINYNRLPLYGSAGRMRNPVLTGICYAAVMQICLAFLTQRHVSLHTFVAVGAVSVLLFATLLTKSRGALIGFSVSVLVFVGLWLRSEVMTFRRLGFLAGLMSMILLIYAVLPTDELAADREFAVPDLVDLNQVDPTRRGLSYRDHIWREALARIGERPIVGRGIATPFAIRGIDDREFRHPHNFYLSTAFYGGGVALLFLVGLLVNALGRIDEIEAGFRRNLAGLLLVFALVVFAIDGDRVLVKVDFIWLLFWFPVGILFGQVGGERAAIAGWKSG
ncbi:MAG: O-antigen ligase family protein [Proteobacteria bacterium]|nr:O-antigen ligase family protein [Pseudomonadota bacterium]